MLNWIRETFKTQPKEDSYEQRLISEITSHFNRKDAALVRLAYEKARLAHEGQFRDSGEPYIIHPLEVAKILVSWMPNLEAVIAAILHDILEDTTMTERDIQQLFGDNVLFLVQGVTKLSKLRFRNKDELQAESFRNMLVAISQDLRVILVKLADRLHNMRTLDSLSPQRQRKIALETKTIYVPIASRLGLNKVWNELQEYCFQYLHPWRYSILFHHHTQYQNSTEPQHESITRMIRDALSQAHINADVQGRFKMLSSVYSKMQQKSLHYQDVHDKEGFRILVNKWEDVYCVLGHIHKLFRPVPGLFKDYIAIPKSNGYQSLHTVVIGPHNNTMEIQIRTHKMHTEAENGSANHWQYKHETQFGNGKTDRRYQWLQGLMHLHNEHDDTGEFIEHVKLELFHDDIYVFSPKGDVITLPKGSTVVDYAFNIHSKKGLHFDHAIVNGKHVNPDYILHSGDRILINTNQHDVSPDLFLYARTARARSALRKHFKDFDNGIIQHAYNTLQNVSGLDDNAVKDSVKKYAKSKNMSDMECMLMIGIKRCHPYKIVTPLTPYFKHNHPWLERAHCCQPLPGDTIVAVSHQDAYEIHQKGCHRTLGKHAIASEWDTNDRQLWETVLRFPSDMKHHDVLAYCSKHNIEIVSTERTQQAWLVTASVMHRQDVEHLTKKFGHLLPQVARSGPALPPFWAPQPLPMPTPSETSTTATD